MSNYHVGIITAIRKSIIKYFFPALKEKIKVEENQILAYLLSSEFY